MKECSSKGVSVFISHVIAIAILFVVMIGVSVEMYNYYFSVKEESQQSQARILSQRVADSVIRLYDNYRQSDYEPEEGKNTTLSEVYLNIPESISGNNYIISLENHGDLWIDGSLGDEESYQDDRPYTRVRIETEGKPSAVFVYPIYNVVSVEAGGSVRRATKIKLSYLRGMENGDVRDYVKMERFL